jgi:hypothetical protein
VLDIWGNLWINQFIGSTWTRQKQVDANVATAEIEKAATRQGSNPVNQTFQVVDANTVFVLGSNGNLWLELGPFGQPAPTYWTTRYPVDGNVLGFAVIDVNTVVVLGTDLNLWLETAPSSPPPLKHFWTDNRQLLDSNVVSFAILDDIDTLFTIKQPADPNAPPSLTLWFQGSQIANDIGNCQVIGRFERSQGLVIGLLTLGYNAATNNKATLSYMEIPLS